MWDSQPLSLTVYNLFFLGSWIPSKSFQIYLMFHQQRKFYMFIFFDLILYAIVKKPMWKIRSSKRIWSLPQTNRGENTEYLKHKSTTLPNFIIMNSKKKQQKFKGVVPFPNRHSYSSIYLRFPLGIYLWPLASGKCWPSTCVGHVAASVSSQCRPVFDWNPPLGNSLGWTVPHFWLLYKHSLEMYMYIYISFNATSVIWCKIAIYPPEAGQQHFKAGYSPTTELGKSCTSRGFCARSCAWLLSLLPRPLNSSL